MAVKLIDIADKAGVSIATVSRVIKKGQTDNNPSSQKVLHVIEKMGYKPTRIRKTKGIGNFLFATIGIPQEVTSEDPVYSISSFYGHFLYGVERELRKLQGTLNVCHAEDGVKDCTTWIQQMVRDTNSRGIFILGNSVNQINIDIVSKTTPVVVIHAIPGILEVDSVAPDDKDGLQQVVRRLVKLGHRRIAFWTDLDTDGQVVDHTVLNLQGYQNGMKEAGLTYNRIYSEEVGDLPFFERMERGFRAYLEDIERPTAIVCPGDGFAYHVLRLAQRHGINVPRELSIFGFDDSEFSAHSHPALSSVNIQRVCMSREAVRLMARRLSEPDFPATQVIVQARVIERETSGPAPK